MYLDDLASAIRAQNRSPRAGYQKVMLASYSDYTRFFYEPKAQVSRRVTCMTPGLPGWYSATVNTYRWSHMQNCP
jgi:hypothetical protein